jgi:hypothetical protein
MAFNLQHQQEAYSDFNSLRLPAGSVNGLTNKSKM